MRVTRLLVLVLAEAAATEADGVSCGGGYRAARCVLCPQGNGRARCNGGCVWKEGVCVSKSGQARASKCSQLAAHVAPDQRNPFGVPKPWRVAVAVRGGGLWRGHPLRKSEGRPAASSQPLPSTSAERPLRAYVATAGIQPVWGCGDEPATASGEQDRQPWRCCSNGCCRLDHAVALPSALSCSGGGGGQRMQRVELRCVAMLKTPLMERALQHWVLGARSSALDCAGAQSSPLWTASEGGRRTRPNDAHG